MKMQYTLLHDDTVECLPVKCVLECFRVKNWCPSMFIENDPSFPSQTTEVKSKGGREAPGGRSR